MADGIRTIVRLNERAEKDSVFQTLNKQLGFARRGEAIEERFEEALRTLNGVIATEGEFLVWR